MLPERPRVASRRRASSVVSVVLLREPIRATCCDECHAGVAHALRSSHAVHVRGTGSRTMLFAHGFGCDHNTWRLLVPAFADRFASPCGWSAHAF